MKKFLKKLLFNSDKPNRIRSGVSSGMLTNYDPKDRGLHLLGLYEREIYSFLKKGIDRADTLIDIGANDGYYALAFAKYKEKKIILCEPTEVELKHLYGNLALNGIVVGDNIRIIDKFVTNKFGANEVPVNSLFSKGSKAFVLIDVDGGELDIVSAFDFTMSDNVDWLIETHTVKLEEDVSELLKRNGYTVQIIKNAWWRTFIPEQRPLEHNRWLFASRVS